MADLTLPRDLGSIQLLCIQWNAEIRTLEIWEFLISWKYQKMSELLRFLEHRRVYFFKHRKVFSNDNLILETWTHLWKYSFFFTASIREFISYRIIMRFFIIRFVKFSLSIFSWLLSFLAILNCTKLSDNVINFCRILLKYFDKIKFNSRPNK